MYNLTVEGAHARFSVDADAINRVMRYLAQFDVRSLTSAPPTLEDLFLRHYKLQGRRHEMNLNAYTGTRALLRLIIRRDWLVLAVCVVLPALLAVITAATFKQLLPTAASLEAFVFETANIPAETALLGHIYAPTIAGLTAWRWSAYSAVLVGLGSALFVVRHTRTQEEAGRFELLGSTVVGRQAALSASLIVTFGANVVIAALVAGGLIGYGLPVAGSVVLGLSVAAVGVTFAAVGGVAAQVTESAGTAKGIAAAILGLCYMLRAAGDAGEHSGLSWLSPIGWMQQIQALC